MSEEEKEAIEDISKIIYNTNFDTIILVDNEGFTMWNNTFEIILNLIDKLQNENISLKKQIKLMREINLTDEIENNFIRKDKIRDKIKELEEDKKGYEEEGFENMKFATEITIIALEELLGDDINEKL